MEQVIIEITEQKEKIDIEVYEGGRPPSSTDDTFGIVQLATSSEVEEGTNNSKAVTPATLKPELAKKADNETIDLTLIFENNLI